MEAILGRVVVHCRLGQPQRVRYFTVGSCRIPVEGLGDEILHPFFIRARGVKPGWVQLGMPTRICSSYRLAAAGPLVEHNPNFLAVADAAPRVLLPTWIKDLNRRTVCWCEYLSCKYNFRNQENCNGADSVSQQNIFTRLKTDVTETQTESQTKFVASHI